MFNSCSWTICGLSVEMDCSCPCHGRGLTKFVDVAWTPCGLNRGYGVEIDGTHPSYCLATARKLPGCCREVARQLRGYCPDAARQLTGSCSDDSVDVAWILHDLLPYSLIRGWCHPKIKAFKFREATTNHVRLNVSKLSRGWAMMTH